MIVASFYAPRPEHPFFQDYTPFLNLLRLSCEKFGHQHVVLTDDPAVGDDAYVTDLPRSLMKATVAAQYAWLSDLRNANTPTLLTGADCVLGRDPVCMALAHGRGTLPDIVITTDDRFQDCRMNCGAIYIPQPSVVAPVWKAALDACGDVWGDDQTSVYGALKASDLVVHELPCDPYNLAPDNPGEDCSRGVVLHFRGPRKGWMVDYCHHWLGLGDGIQIVTAPSQSEDVMVENAIAALALGMPEVVPMDAHDGHAILIGGGPSLADTLPEIRWRIARGQTVFALNGAAKYLHEHGIYSDYGVLLDPRAENVKFITPHVGEWLVASQCHPDVIAEANKDRARLWHFASERLMEVLPATSTAIAGSITVGLCAMCLVFAMGYRKIHLYGYDSSNAETGAHAYAQSETEPESRYLEVWCGDRSFICGPAMYSQAKEFQGWADMLVDVGAIITVHGDGLLPTIARSMSTAVPLEKEMAA